MFGISFSEIFLICIIALIVLGPKQLPQIASRLGLMIYSITNYLTCLKHEIYHNSGVGELISTKSELIKTYSKARSAIGAKNTAVHDEITEHPVSKNNPQTLYQPELDFDAQPELFDRVTLLNLKEQS
jgi:sec-independent protein translocase protein TatB